MKYSRTGALAATFTAMGDSGSGVETASNIGVVGAFVVVSAAAAVGFASAAKEPDLSLDARSTSLDGSVAMMSGAPTSMVATRGICASRAARCVEESRFFFFFPSTIGAARSAWSSGEDARRDRWSCTAAPRLPTAGGVGSAANGGAGCGVPSAGGGVVDVAGACGGGSDGAAAA